MDPQEHPLVSGYHAGGGGAGGGRGELRTPLASHTLRPCPGPSTLVPPEPTALAVRTTGRFVDNISGLKAFRFCSGEGRRVNPGEIVCETLSLSSRGFAVGEHLKD